MKWLWWGVIALSVFVIVRAWWAWSGACSGDPETMDCVLTPVWGWPVAIGATVAAVLAIMVAIFMLFKDKIETPTDASS